MTPGGVIESPVNRLWILAAIDLDHEPEKRFRPVSLKNPSPRPCRLSLLSSLRASPIVVHSLLQTKFQGPRFLVHVEIPSLWSRTLWSRSVVIPT
jgi:hypothetical protein